MNREVSQLPFRVGQEVLIEAVVDGVGEGRALVRIKGHNKKYGSGWVLNESIRGPEWKIAAEAAASGARLALEAERNATEQALPPMIVAHNDGAEMTTHPLDKPCSKCRSPIEVTDEMLKRAESAYDASEDGYAAPVYSRGRSMRAALEAALNG